MSHWPVWLLGPLRKPNTHKKQLLTHSLYYLARVLRFGVLKRWKKKVSEDKPDKAWAFVQPHRGWHDLLLSAPDWYICIKGSTQRHVESSAMVLRCVIFLNQISRLSVLDFELGGFHALKSWAFLNLKQPKSSDRPQLPHLSHSLDAAEQKRHMWLHICEFYGPFPLWIWQPK